MEADQSNQEFCLRWHNWERNMLKVFGELFRRQTFTDIVLAVDDGRSLPCHRVILAACSPYFRKIFIDSGGSERHIVMKDVKLHVMRAILEYMYSGEVSINYDELDEVLQLADLLKVKGLTEENIPNLEQSKWRRREATPEREPKNEFKEKSRQCEEPMHRHKKFMHRNERSFDDECAATVEGRNGAITCERLDPDDISRGTLAVAPALTNLAASPRQSATSPSHLVIPPYFNSLGSLDHSQMQQHRLAIDEWALRFQSLAASTGFTNVLTARHHPLLMPRIISQVYENSPSATSVVQRHASPTSTTDVAMSHRESSILRGVLGQTATTSASLVNQNVNPNIGHYTGYGSHYPSPSNGSVSYQYDDRPSSLDLSKSSAAPGASTLNVPDGDKPTVYSTPASKSKTGSSKNRSEDQPEWRRYKKYSKEDIEAAIAAVMDGVSALQASRKFRVPSRTLYDKVKKIGFIRNGRRGGRGAGKNGKIVVKNDNDAMVEETSARFPSGIGANIDGSIYETPSSSDNRADDNNLAIEQAAYTGNDSENSKDWIEFEDSEAIAASYLAKKEEPQTTEYEVQDLSMNRRTEIRA